MTRFDHKAQSRNLKVKTWRIACLHNPNLLQFHDSHLNVEVAAMIENVKYLHKYLVKMPDRAEVVMQLADGLDVDETKIYLDGRYISTSEAVWRGLRFNVHYQKPPVVRLAVHLNGEQFVTWQEEDNPELALLRQKPTALTAWFDSNKKPEHAAGRVLLYADYVTAYRFVKGEWQEPTFSTYYLDLDFTCQSFLNKTPLSLLRISRFESKPISL